ncbi:hypothetical protein E4U52_003209, partial [Claviceps spartinae]
MGAVGAEQCRVPAQPSYPLFGDQLRRELDLIDNDGSTSGKSWTTRVRRRLWAEATYRR